MDWGSVADWVSGVGGAGSAASAATFYWLDRRQSRVEREKEEVQIARTREAVLEESVAIAFSSAGAIALIGKQHDANLLTEDMLRFYSSLLTTKQVRLRELATLIHFDARCTITLGQMADALGFAGFPFVTVQTWIDASGLCVEQLRVATKKLKPVLQSGP